MNISNNYLYDVSVVIVSWNSKDDLKVCLPSITETKNLNLQIIVVDNKSDDETVEWLKALCSSNVEVVLLDSNLGFSAACNKGIEKSRGRYVFFLNPDTRTSPEALNKLVKMMDEKPEIAACAPKLVNQDGTLQYSTRTLPNLWTEFCQEFYLSSLFPHSQIFSRYYMAHWNHQEAQCVDAVTGAALMVRFECLESIGKFDNTMSFMFYEDLDLCYRLKDKGYQLMYFPESCVKHIGGNSTKHIRQKARRYLLSSRFKYHQKHGAWWHLVFLWVIHFFSGLIFTIGLNLLSVLGIKKESAQQLKTVYQTNIRFLFGF